MTPASSASRSAREHLIAAVTERLPYKLAALFFALVLWMIVSAEEQSAEWVDVQLAFALDSNVTLVGKVPRVRALIAGKGRELMKLYSSPPTMHRVISADSDSVVALDLRPSDIDLGNIDAKANDVRPRLITIPVRQIVPRTVHEPTVTGSAGSVARTASRPARRASVPTPPPAPRGGSASGIIDPRDTVPPAASETPHDSPRDTVRPPARDTTRPPASDSSRARGAGSIRADSTRSARVTGDSARANRAPTDSTRTDSGAARPRAGDP